MRIIIVGAGIGGLAAAGLLNHSGHQVQLIERASGFSEVGAGIQLSPNGVRVIAELGLGPQLAKVGTTPERIVLRRWKDDAELLVRPLGDLPRERYGMPYYNVFRPDLIEVLVQAVEEVPISFGTVVTNAGSEGGSAYVELDGRERLAADVVIGADGINSVVRQALFGVQPSRFTGWVAYRALVPRDRVARMPVEVTNWLGPNAHLVSYFVGKQQRYLNLVCVVHEPDWAIESWTEKGDLAQLRGYFDGWSRGVQEVLDCVEEPVYKWALHDRPSLDSWTDGQVALLGDACHPMVPFMAQGACQAIEDAAVLTRCLDGVEPQGLHAALRAYEATRLPRASKMQNRSFDNATVFHYSDGEDQLARDRVFAEINKTSTEGGSLASMDWLYGHDPLTVELERG